MSESDGERGTTISTNYITMKLMGWQTRKDWKHGRQSPICRHVQVHTYTHTHTNRDRETHIDTVCKLLIWEDVRDDQAIILGQRACCW